MQIPDFSDIPTDSLISLRDAINIEIKKRKVNHIAGKRIHWMNKMDFSAMSSRDLYSKLVEINSEVLLELPTTIRMEPYQNRHRYLPFLLAQDWAHLFASADTDRKDFYVYLHVDPREPTSTILQTIVLRGKPFYVGKGCGKRAFNLKRNQGHDKKLRQIISSGYDEKYVVQIICENLNERQALSIEAQLIYYFGSIYDEHTKGILFNLADHDKPKFDGPMKKLPPSYNFSARWGDTSYFS